MSLDLESSFLNDLDLDLLLLLYLLFLEYDGDLDLLLVLNSVSGTYEYLLLPPLLESLLLLLLLLLHSFALMLNESINHKVPSSLVTLPTKVLTVKSLPSASLTG